MLCIYIYTFTLYLHNHIYIYTLYFIEREREITASAKCPTLRPLWTTASRAVMRSASSGVPADAAVDMVPSVDIVDQLGGESGVDLGVPGDQMTHVKSDGDLSTSLEVCFGVFWSFCCHGSRKKHPFDEDPRLYQLMPESHSLWGRVQPYFLVQCVYFKKYPFLIRLAIPVGGAFLHDTRSVTFGARKAAN